MVKDRLADLRSKQNGKPIDEEDGPNSAQDPLITREDWNSVDGFLERCTTANRELGIIEGYLAQIKTIHQKILSHPGSDKEFSGELRTLYGKFADESRRLRSVVQKLDAEANAEKPLSAPEENKNSVNNRIKKNQIRVISTRLFNVINKFNSEQGDYKQKHMQEIQRTLKIQGHEVAESDVNEAIEKGEIDGLTKGLMLAVADKKALSHDVQARHSGILALETSIRELHELFTDMLHLVQSQGEMIDNIEQNVNTAVDYANKAKVNVIGAKTAQRRARKMKIFIFIGLTALAIILFFILQGFVCMYTPIC